jgi:hypothetical protein
MLCVISCEEEEKKMRKERGEKRQKMKDERKRPRLANLHHWFDARLSSRIRARPRKTRTIRYQCRDEK